MTDRDKTMLGWFILLILLMLSLSSCGLSGGISRRDVHYPDAIAHNDPTILVTNEGYDTLIIRNTLGMRIARVHSGETRCLRYFGPTGLTRLWVQNTLTRELYPSDYFLPDGATGGWTWRLGIALEQDALLELRGNELRCQI